MVDCNLARALAQCPHRSRPNVWVRIRQSLNYFVQRTLWTRAAESFNRCFPGRWGGRVRHFEQQIDRGFAYAAKRSRCLLANEMTILLQEQQEAFHCLRIDYHSQSTGSRRSHLRRSRPVLQDAEQWINRRSTDVPEHPRRSIAIALAM